MTHGDLYDLQQLYDWHSQSIKRYIRPRKTTIRYMATERSLKERMPWELVTLLCVITII